MPGQFRQSRVPVALRGALVRSRLFILVLRLPRSALRRGEARVVSCVAWRVSILGGSLRNDVMGGWPLSVTFEDG